MPEIVVVGAGVLGLSTALVLSEFPGVHVTVVAEYGPHHPGMNPTMTDKAAYTSAWAGAHFRPSPSHDDAEYDMAMITRLTQSKFREWSAIPDQTAIKFVEGIEYFEAPDEVTRTLGRGYTEEMDNFAVVKSGVPAGVKFAVRYDTWVVNPPVFLRFLHQQLKANGTSFVQKKLESLREVNDLVSGYPVIVNCSGNGLLYHGGFDPQVVPIRGQTLLLDPPEPCPYSTKTITHQSKEGLWTFLISRPHNGGMILGGTKQVGDTFDGVREADTHAVCARASVLYPELMKTGENGRKYFDIKGINVGFRPARKGGLRIDLERKRPSSGQLNHVIHNYGAGGMGYELSYGSALKVLEKYRQLAAAKL